MATPYPPKYSVQCTLSPYIAQTSKKDYNTFMKHYDTTSRIIRYAQAPFFEIRYTQESQRHYERHAHPTLSIGFMCKSSTLFTTHKGTFTLTHGALAVIEPYVQHTCNPLQHKKRSYVMVYFDTEYCRKLQEKYFGETPSLRPLSASLIFHQGLFQTFEKSILGLIQGYDALHVRTLEIWLEEFLWLFTHPEWSQIKDATLQEIAFYLRNRIDEPLSLKGLSKHFAMNSFVMVRKFKNAFGCTPTHYWHDARIHHAQKLLQDQTPIALCAQYCGFVDQSHFHRFFKRRTAMTPREYQVNFIQ